MLVSEQIIKTMLGDRLTMFVTQHKTLISCQPCKGTGFTSREELTDYHRSEYKTVFSQCERCSGDGRVVEITNRIRFDAKYPWQSCSTASVEYERFDPIAHKDIDFSSVNMRHSINLFPEE
jgi:RecJ-like exonuclease